MVSVTLTQPALSTSSLPVRKERILVVEDEEDLLELITYNLSREGYRVSGVTSGEAALREARTQLPDLILLDLLLPQIDGLEVCKLLRNDRQTRHIPVIMLTAKTEEADVVAGLELGADDYIPKPFSPRVLVARVRAVLRRRGSAVADKDAPVRIHELVIHPGRHEVLLAGRPISLTYTEFRLLHFLAQRPGWAFTRGQIVDAVRGENYAVTERSVDVQVAGLRKKLGKYAGYIETVRGVGYRFKE
jgi:two-component system phosphate regulon response regulator PhoB